VTPEHLDQLLHPTVDPKTDARYSHRLPASPGAAQGTVVLALTKRKSSPRKARRWCWCDRKPARMIFTDGRRPGDRDRSRRHDQSRGVVARGMGKTCVSGASALEVDYSQQQFSVNGEVITKASGSQ